MAHSESPAHLVFRSLRLLGRVHFTLFLLLAGALVFAIGTVVESRHGREEAFAHVYGTAWFDFFLFLIALNLVLAVVIRIPIQRHQWGFVLTHLSIVLLLVGAWISRTFGYEGRLYVPEGHAESELALDAAAVTGTWPADGGSVAEAEFTIPLSGRVSNRVLQRESADAPELRITGHVPEGVAHVDIGAGGPTDPPAVALRVTGPRVRDRAWLIAGDERSGSRTFGRVAVSLVEGEPPAGPFVRIGALSDGRLRLAAPDASGAASVVDLEPGRAVPLGATGLVLEVEQALPHARRQLVVEPASPGHAPGRPYLRLQARKGSEQRTGWLRFGGRERWSVGGSDLEVAYGRAVRRLPFSVHLHDFAIDYHPGSGRPAEYRSHVTVRQEGEPPVESEHVISMNRPLDVAGFRLFQSSYQLGERGRPDATILSVARDPGAPVVYLAFALTTIGIAWYLRRRPTMDEPATEGRPARGRPALKAPTASPKRSATSGAVAARQALVAALLALAGWSVSAGPGRAEPAIAPAGSLPVEATRGWAILSDGRTKPLQTHADELALRVSGRSRLGGFDSLEMLWGWVLAPEDARQRPWVRVDSLELKAELALEPGAKRFAHARLLASDEFRRLVDAGFAKRRMEREPTRLENDAVALYSTLSVLQELMEGRGPAIVPLTQADGSWTPIGSLPPGAAPGAEAVVEGWRSLASAYRAQDAPAFRSAAEGLSVALRGVAPSTYPSAGSLSLELFHEDLNAFGKAWKLYLLGFLVLLFMGFSERRWLHGLGTGLLVLGFVLHAVGIGLRWAIAGRAPVSNMYESLVFMGAGAIALGIVPEVLHRKRFLGMTAGVVGFLTLVFAENLPIDSSISPLVPVLANTYWLSVHVMTIMLSYSAFALAMALGHVALYVSLFQADRTERLSSITATLYRTLQVGILFLAAGIACGAVWANESWGRYWGWDPKETWSLITFFVYLAVVHAHFAGWVREFGLAVTSIIAFMSVVMTYYGVNFVLAAGMHSYGFAEGGRLQALLYVVVELVIVTLAWLRYRAMAAPPGVPAEA
jgi:cytochrome c-type biogenesis protein CcsB